jgi:hypothetical protein
VIIRPQGQSLLFITQPDHAAAAADLVIHFDGYAANPRRDALHLAVREHDCGWHELDDDLVFDDGRGAALDFIGVPEPLKRSVWPIAIERIAPRSAYAVALIAEHALFVYNANRDKAEWQPFFEQMEMERDALLTRSGLSSETLKADYPFLGIADLLSLSFCHGWQDSRERFGRTVRCEASAVTISPTLLPPAPVALHVRARAVPNQRYPSVAALRDTLRSAPAEHLMGVARGGLAP